MKILILGITGLIGRSIYRSLSAEQNLVVSGTVRNRCKAVSDQFANQAESIFELDVCDITALEKTLASVNPDVVINCTGVTKHISGSDDPMITLPINAFVPHYLAFINQQLGARTIHISSDCVFSGKRGGYCETDLPDAEDLYGYSKYLGELHGQRCVTLRTSTIGHEANTHHGLLEWFLMQKKMCKGFTRAHFSGLTSLELARVVRDYVLPNDQLSGLYNVAGPRINKFDLLKIVSEIYDVTAELERCDRLVIDRSLNGQLFFKETGYLAPDWETQIHAMYCQRYSF